MECPDLLQLGQILARGGYAGKARVGEVGDDWTLDAADLGGLYAVVEKSHVLQMLCGL
jgi:hypothetical protein